MIHNAQKFINEATPEQKQQITTDMFKGENTYKKGTKAVAVKKKK